MSQQEFSNPDSDWLVAELPASQKQVVGPHALNLKS